MSTSNFRSAYEDYRFLRERDYPEKATLKVVGDRYRLTRSERNSLFRGVLPEKTAEARKRKRARPADIAGENLGVDWYNVLITVESYLRGAPLFLADDGMVRDTAAAHGSYRSTDITENAIREILRGISSLAPGRVDVFLDSPIAFSGIMAEDVRKRSTVLPCPCAVSVAYTADFPLKSYEGIVASSDSVILDSARRVFDLPRHLLEQAFGFTPPLLPDLDLLSL